MRGDLSAEAMSIVFSNLPNVVYNKSLIGDRDLGIGISQSQIETYINEVINDKNIKPGDNFFLYLFAHGNSNSSEEESTLTPGDEYMVFGDGQSEEGLLTDDELYSMLSGMDEGVNKWIIIDSCHSGGFWGNFSNDDDGDLEKLKNAALLACAKENELGYASTEGIGLFTLALIDGFAKNNINNKYFVDLNEDGIITFSEIAYYCSGWVNLTNYKGKPVIQMDMGDSVIFTPDLWDPCFFKTADFADDAISAVPIPGSFLLLACGLLGFSFSRWAKPILVHLNLWRRYIG